MLKKTLVETLDKTLDGDDEGADMVVPEFVNVLEKPESPFEVAEELDIPLEVAEELDIPFEVTEEPRDTVELGVPGLGVSVFVEEEAVKPIDVIVFVDEKLIAGALEMGLEPELETGLLELDVVALKLAI